MISDPHEIAAEAGSLAVKIGAHLDTPSEQSNSPMEAITHNLDAYRYYSLGVEKAEQFQNSQAIQLFKKAIEADPKFAMAYARIGYAYAVQDYQHQQARPYFDKAIRYSASLPPVKLLYIEAWSAIANSDYNSAIGVLRQITTQYPNETEAYCQLSRILRGQERVEEAAELLRDAIQKNPEAKDLYNAYGLILLSLNRPTESIGAYKQYVALAPQNPNSHDSLGMSYELAGEYEAALAEFNQALRLDPEFEPSIVHMGDTYYQQGRYHEALDEYRRYIQVTASTDAKAIGYSDLSTVYRTMGDLDNAQVAASEELRFNRNAVWDSLVIALAKGQKARAIALKTALFANLPNPERGSPRDLRSEFYYRGYIELKTGESQLALTHFKSALQHLPPSSGIDLREDCLANAYFDLGMTSESIAEYQRILKLNPNYPLAYFHLGKSYLRAHRNREAQEAFQHFLESSPTADQDSPSLLEAKNTKFRAA
jgi:tetratricopeptide (TPR) repeat protein